MNVSYSWLLQVARPDGRVEGTAFPVTATQALTCVHVVAGMDRVRLRAAGRPGEKWDARAEALAANVPGVDGHPGSDVALIILPSASPPLTPAPLGPLTGIQPDTRLRAFGFPERYPDGLWAEIQVRRPDFSGECYQADFPTARGPSITKGFSGGPAIDSTDRVVAMTTSVAPDAPWLIPLTTLAVHWKPLAVLTAPPAALPGAHELHRGISELIQTGSMSSKAATRCFAAARTTSPSSISPSGNSASPNANWT